MMQRMARRSTRLFHVIAMALATLVVSAGNVMAADQSTTEVDARLEGYGRPVTNEGSTATMWMLLIVLSIITLGVLFKDAKRSHLD